MFVLNDELQFGIYFQLRGVVLLLSVAVVWLLHTTVVTRTGSGDSLYLTPLSILNRQQSLSAYDRQSQGRDAPSAGYKRQKSTDSSLLWPNVINVANSENTQVYISVSEQGSLADDMINSTSDGFSASGPTYNSSVIMGYPNEATGSCSFPMCDLNYGRKPIKFQKPGPKESCSRVADCVTLITKTRYRLHLAVRLIKSFHQFYPGAKVIVADDYNANYTQSAPSEWFEVYDKGVSGLVTYVQVEEGISNGRNLAMQLATTEYAVVADDDHVFTNYTDLEVLLRVLETTDAIIAGGQFTKFRYDSLLRVFYTKRYKVHMLWYPYLFYESLYPFADCYVTDRIQNFFMGKRKEIIDTGGWDRRRKIFEHDDFFLNLRRKSKKVVYCPGVLVRHDSVKGNLHSSRDASEEQYKKFLKEKWRYDDAYLCFPESYRWSYMCRPMRRPLWMIPCPELAAKWGDTVTEGVYNGSVCGYPMSSFHP